MIAAAVQILAGDDVQARTWAATVRERRPTLTRHDFFRAFPIKETRVKSRLAAALEKLGF